MTVPDETAAPAAGVPAANGDSKAKVATDLGYLLAKHPDRHHTNTLPFGTAHVFYPEATPRTCTAVLMVEVDPVGLTKRYQAHGPAGGDSALAQYVNDRPYAASSFLSVAIASTLKSAMKGESRDRPDLAAGVNDLVVEIPCLACRGGRGLAADLFEPLGVVVDASPIGLDDAFPEWGQGPYLRLKLSGRVRLSDLLTALYILIPVMDDDKHYWVDQAELEKLLEKGGEWLRKHPKRDVITSRYLKRQRHLVNDATARMDALKEFGEASEALEAVPGAGDKQAPDSREEALEATVSLRDRRVEVMIAELLGLGASTVADIGCGEGRLLKALLAEKAFSKIAGMDPSLRALDIAESRLKLKELHASQRDRITLIHGSLTYRDERLAGFDAAVLSEVIEHVDESRLESLERVLFEFARPKAILVSTPNRDYNVLFPSLSAGTMRHPDHRFEWTRAEFAEWASTVAARYGYGVRYVGIGDEHPDHGCPTQMAVFELIR